MYVLSVVECHILRVKFTCGRPNQISVGLSNLSRDLRFCFTAEKDC